MQALRSLSVVEKLLQMPPPPTDTQRRESAPGTLQSVRELTQKVDQPQETEMKQILKAYSFDEDGSEDEQPAHGSTKKVTTPPMRYSMDHLQGRTSTEGTEYKSSSRRQTSCDQLRNPGKVVESDASSAGGTSDEEEGWVVEEKTNSLSQRLPASRKKRDIAKSAPKPYFFIQDGAKATEAPIPIMKGHTIDTQTSDWQRMGESIAEAVQANLKGKKDEDEVPARMKSYAFDAARGFGMYSQYICPGVSCRDVTAAAKRAAVAQKTLMVKKGWMFPLTLRLCRAIENLDIGAFNVSTASDNTVLLSDFHPWPIENWNNVRYKGRKWRREENGLRI